MIWLIWPMWNVPGMAKPLLEQLLGESKRTVASYQPVLNMQGLVYKGFIPATFGTEELAPDFKLVRDIFEANGSRPFAP